MTVSPSISPPLIHFSDVIGYKFEVLLERKLSIPPIFLLNLITSPAISHGKLPSLPPSVAPSMGMIPEPVQGLSVALQEETTEAKLPEDFIMLLKVIVLPHVLEALETNLKTNDIDWIIDFIDLGGISLLIDILSFKHKKSRYKLFKLNFETCPEKQKWTKWLRLIRFVACPS
jgi:hypothetical protein